MTNQTKDNHDRIRLEALDLGVGSSKRLVCVFCNGGRTRERTLSITRTDDGIVYKCFRDKCPAKGVVDSKGTFATKQKEINSDRKLANPYDGKTYNLSEESYAYLVRKFQLTDEDLRGWKQTEQGDILIPMRDCYGRRFGYVDRRYIGLVGTERKPKAINRYDTVAVPNVHFPQPISSGVTSAILVEDIVSAHRVAHHHFCIAILGTKLSDRVATHLKDIGITRVVFFLDGDANKTGIEESRKHRMLFDTSMSVRRPPADPDPKDMDEAELVSWISTIKNTG